MEALVFGETDPMLRGALGDVGCLDVSHGSLIDLALYDDQTPDLIVIDLAATDALAVRRVVRMFRSVPVVVCCELDLIEDAFAAGATGAVVKPVRPVELVARLRVALRGRAEDNRRIHRERRLTDTIEVLQREKHDLERLACVDSLTGIANRRHALLLLDAEWRRSAREHQPLGLVIVDLDCFHAFNERYGHLGGDGCLQRVCGAMVTCLRRPSDFLGRYGGEELIAVLPGTDAAGAKIVAERMRAAVEALAIPHAGSACASVVTVTTGFAACVARPDAGVDKLIADADAALLRAKAAGRNRVGGEAPVVRPSRVSAQRWTRYAPVFADPWFADRIPVFLDNVRALGESVRASELHRVRVAARQLRASAASYGFAEVDRIAGALALAAREADRRAIHELANELLEYVSHVQVVYRRRLEAMIELPSETVELSG